jgi:transposase
MPEDGIVRPKGVTTFRQAVVAKLESAKAQLTALSQEMLRKLIEELVALEEQLASDQEPLDTLAATHPACQRLMTIPGLGPITATALRAAVGAVGVLKNGRQCAAWGGLVPTQPSMGGPSPL